MYAVKVVVQPSKPADPSAHYSKTYYEGVYIPKGKECEQGKIKQQVQEYVEPRLAKQNPGLSFEFKISVKKLADDFLVCEDKK